MQCVETDLNKQPEVPGAGFDAIGFESGSSLSYVDNGDDLRERCESSIT